MEKAIYIIRHCEAIGQGREASLTENGFRQAKILSEWLVNKRISRIISSPYLRAVQTIAPFSENNNIEIETDNRLIERILSTQDFPDWLEKLETTFSDFSLTYEGGESSEEATARIVELINEISTSDHESIAVVAHGGIIALLLHYYDKNFGFEQWKNICNPDVFLLRLSENIPSCERIWEE